MTAPSVLLPVGILPLAVAASVMLWPGRESRRQPGSHAARESQPVARSAPWHRWVARRMGSPVGEESGERVAGAMALLAVSLRGGAGLVQSVAAVAQRVGGGLGSQLDTVVAGWQWGLDESQAWAGVSAGWRPAARAIRMAALSGMAPADLIEAAADDMRREQAAAIRVATARLGVRLVLPLGLAFLPAFVLTTILPVVLALARQVLQQGW